jgi:hypothetical protein
VQLAEQLDLGTQLGKGRKDLSAELVRLDSEEVIKQLAQRIYDARCRIVHSKSSSIHDTGPGLIAGTSHDDHIRPESPLMEHSVQQALVAAAEPLRQASWVESVTLVSRFLFGLRGDVSGFGDPLCPVKARTAP